VFTLSVVILPALESVEINLMKKAIVLVVEDEALIRLDLKEMLEEEGYVVAGEASDGETAVTLTESLRPDLVILDLRLADGGLGTEFAAQLPPLGRPGILYVTGNMSQVVLTHGDGCLSKPYRSVDLLRSLEIVAGIVATGKAQPPFPQGFHLLHPAIAESQTALI